MDTYHLRINVNPELVLDAGYWEQVELDGEPQRIVHPPGQTLFCQLLDYLERSPVQGEDSYATSKYQALAATNVCLRWGSYLAVLADRHKPLDPHLKMADYAAISHLADGEMARINIEASAALAHWIDLWREDFSHYQLLVNRALSLLPMTRKTLTGWPERTPFWAVTAQAELIQHRMDEVKADISLAERLKEVELYPTRVFANALVNYSWRNNDIEDIHAGRGGDYSLSHRRIRPADERRLFRATALRMREGIVTLQSLLEAPGEWSQKIAPYHFVPDLLITPTHWTLTEETIEFSLPVVDTQK